MTWYDDKTANDVCKSHIHKGCSDWSTIWTVMNE